MNTDRLFTSFCCFFSAKKQERTVSNFTIEICSEASTEPNFSVQRPAHPLSLRSAGGLRPPVGLVSLVSYCTDLNPALYSH